MKHVNFDYWSILMLLSPVSCRMSEQLYEVTLPDGRQAFLSEEQIEYYNQRKMPSSLFFPD